MNNSRYLRASSVLISIVALIMVLYQLGRDYCEEAAFHTGINLMIPIYGTKQTVACFAGGERKLSV